MLTSNLNYNGLWRCGKCRTMVKNEYNRCSFCGAKRITGSANTNAIAKESDNRVTNNIITAVKRCSPSSKKRLWAWMEDNIL